MNQIIESEINRALDALFPVGEGMASRARVEHVLRQVAQRAEQEGKNGVLLSLLTTEDIATRLSITPRWVRNLAARVHARWGAGYQVRGTNPWLFTPEELHFFEEARRDRVGRPSKEPGQ